MNVSPQAFLAGLLAAVGAVLLAPASSIAALRRAIVAGAAPTDGQGRARPPASAGVGRGWMGVLGLRVAAVRSRVVGGQGPREQSAAAHARLAEELAALAAAGLDPRAAWSALDADAASAASSTVRAVQAMIAAGGDIGDGLRSATDPYARWLEVAWHVSWATGAPLSGVLDELAGGLRRHVDAARARTAAVAGPRATSRVLSAMPAMGLALALFIGVNPFAAMFGSPAGRGSFVLGVLAWAGGQMWSAALVRHVVRRS